MSVAKERLPMLDLQSNVIGTKELQKISAKNVSDLVGQGPAIVQIGGLKRAVLVEYNQYIHLQETFGQIFKQMSVINQLLPRIPDGHSLEISKLKLEISGTLRKIVEESPEASPFADLMDAVLGVALAFNPENAPAKLKSATQKLLSTNIKKVETIHARPKRNLVE